MIISKLYIDQHLAAYAAMGFSIAFQYRVVDEEKNMVEMETLVTYPTRMEIAV